MNDTSVFPHPVYKSTVLAPLFDGVKNHFAHSIGEINRAHLVMLHETSILKPEQVSKIAHALQSIEKELDIEACTYTGEFEDYFSHPFYVCPSLILPTGWNICMTMFRITPPEGFGHCPRFLLRHKHVQDCRKLR